MRRAALSLLAAALVLAGLATPASALPGREVSAAQYQPSASYPGMQHLHYEYGPITIEPGQNPILFQLLYDLKPKVPGYVTRFKPNLIYTKSRKVPPVDVIHLHHGVWIIDQYPTLPAGEEKTTLNLPQGYGFHVDPSDSWLLNYMIHNLTPIGTSVKIVYDIDFVPDSKPAAAGITPVRPLWLDVAGISTYPVFDAVRGSGKDGKYTFPDQARGAQRNNIGYMHQWKVPHDLTLVATAGHLHPGGLWNDLDVWRGGQRRRLFRSKAKYFEPAGAVSWDVSMTATRRRWRVAVKAGDVLTTKVTYDTKRASWYESMGIMVVWITDETRPEAVDPFAGTVDTTGLLTHGHLPENDNHGGDPFPLPDARDLADGLRTGSVGIRNYAYGRGDLNGSGNARRPPVVKPGSSITFTNYDATQDMAYEKQAYHTITACKAPCNRSTGIAYPLANGRGNFDSKQLGFGSPAAGVNKWKTPASLGPGTYTYFCRIHPFMRGAFRVK